tara:strand:+ start:345 stop:950 length:606 start_codon:yes stop_codon:yes gene_type:complete
VSLIKHNNNSLSAVTSMASLSTGSMTLISEQTASGASTVSFTSGIDSTYPIYKFEFINYHANSDNPRPYIQASTNGGSSYGVTVTTTAFRATHSENDSQAQLEYSTGQDKAQSTDFFSISDLYMNDESDENQNGYIFLFNPSSTTFVKHFIGEFNGMNNVETVHGLGAGYFNTTSAINAFQFKNSAGTIDGTFKLYGIKDS